MSAVRGKQMKKISKAGYLLAILFAVFTISFSVIHVKAEPEPVSEPESAVVSEDGSEAEPESDSETVDIINVYPFLKDADPEKVSELQEKYLQVTSNELYKNGSNDLGGFIVYGGNTSAGAGVSDLDNILKYVITVDVNEDATLHMVYHIDWKVLDDKKEGPLTWLVVGVPNSHCENVKALSKTIKTIKYTNKYEDERGSYVRIDLDRAYYAGEVVSFDFEFTQDYMYQMNYDKEGETVYTFIPGWFDSIYVDELQIRWNANKVKEVSPVNGNSFTCELKDGYYIWTTPLSKGTKFRVEVRYPNDAYNFNKGQYIEMVVPEKKGGTMLDFYFIFFIGIILIAWGLPFLMSYIKWKTTSGLDGYENVKKYTIIEYYKNCPSCGAPRPEKADLCEYCGASFIKTEKVVEEDKLPKEYKVHSKEIFSHTEYGNFRASFAPNTVIRVSRGLRSKPISFGAYLEKERATKSRGGGGCAHSSCACACACACAGGGRAGCSTKDFYNTNLKMKYFEQKTKG